MPAEPDHLSQYQSYVVCPSFRSCRGAVRFYSIRRALVRLNLMAFIILAWFWVSDPEPVVDAKRVQLIPGLSGAANMSLAVSPDGRSFATSDRAGHLALWNNKEGRWARERMFPSEGFIRRQAYSPDGRLLAVGRSERGLLLWDLRPNGRIEDLPVPIDRVKALAFSPDGQTLAVTTERDGQIVLWDIAARCVKMILRCEFTVMSIAFSPDGRFLASGDRGNPASICVWNLETGRRTLEIKRTAGSIMALGFSVDGRVLATAAALERQVRLWDLKSGRLSRVLAGHGFGTNAVSFSPDGVMIATAGGDGMVRIWHISTGEQTAVLDCLATHLGDLAFLPHGKTLVGRTLGDGDIRLIHLNENDGM